MSAVKRLNVKVMIAKMRSIRIMKNVNGLCFVFINSTKFTVRDNTTFLNRLSLPIDGSNEI